MQYSFGRIIALLARKSKVQTGNIAGRFNLTAGELPFFTALQSHEGITQEELTELLCIDKAATARYMKSLESKGYLIRFQDTEDHRQNRLYLTEAAKRLKEPVRDELSVLNMKMTQGIAPAALDALYSALEKMKENLDTMSGEKRRGGSHE